MVCLYSVRAGPQPEDPEGWGCVEVGAGLGRAGRGGRGVIWRLYFCHLGGGDSKAGLGEDCGREHLPTPSPRTWASSRRDNLGLKGSILISSIPNGQQHSVQGSLQSEDVAPCSKNGKRRQWGYEI